MTPDGLASVHAYWARRRNETQENVFPQTIECECWVSTPEEIKRGNLVSKPRPIIPYWMDVRRPTVDLRTIQSYREFD